MTKTITKTRESGFTLLELLLVIGVAALLLIGGIATYRLVSEGNKTTDTTRLLLTIRQQTQTMAQQQGGSYTGLTYNTTTPDANNPLVVAGTLINQQRNPFAGNIVIDVSGANDINLSVQFTNIPKPACVRLMQAMTNPSEVVSVGTATATYTSAGATPQIPVSVANATAACNQTANNITWIFP